MRNLTAPEGATLAVSFDTFRQRWILEVAAAAPTARAAVTAAAAPHAQAVVDDLARRVLAEAARARYPRRARTSRPLERLEQVRALTEIEIPGVPESITSADDRAAETRSLAAIMGALEEEPIEDGYTHHAERAVDAHIEQFGSARLVTAVSASASPARAAALLRLLGRSAKIGAEERRALVRWGLSSQSSEVRDAAVQAVENWEDRSLVALLRGHHERVPWLADYAANVVHDLEE